MEIFNIGPLELIIILLIMFVLLGPKEMILTAQRIGKWIRGFVRSPVWREIMGYSQEIRELPQKLMDDTGLKEALADVQQTTQQAASELNTTVNDAVQAARVPEAEHVRLETNPTSPQAAITPASSPSNSIGESPAPSTAAPSDIEKEQEENGISPVENTPSVLTSDSQVGLNDDSLNRSILPVTVSTPTEEAAAAPLIEEAKPENNKKPRRRVVKISAENPTETPSALQAEDPAPTRVRKTRSRAKAGDTTNSLTEDSPVSQESFVTKDEIVLTNPPSEDNSVTSEPIAGMEPEISESQALVASEPQKPKRRQKKLVQVESEAGEIGENKSQI